MQGTRKKLIFVASTVAGVLALASASSACIVWKGKLTVDPAPVGRTDGSTVIGNEAQHGYCVAPTTAATAKNGESITYTVAPTTSADGTCHTSTNHLAVNTSHTVRVYNHSGSGTDPYTGWPYTKSGSTWVWTANSGCFNGGVFGDSQGSFTTSSTGAGSLTANLSLAANNINGASDASEVCVGTTTNPGSNVGIFAPLQVVSV